MKSIKFIISFVVGVALGSLATWKLVKNKYEQIAQEEIDSVKEVFRKERESKPEVKDKEPVEPEKTKRKDKDSAEIEKPISTNRTEYYKCYKYYNYNNDSKTSENTETDNKDTEKPYIITPEEAGECDEYDFITLIYYADGVLTDDCDEVIENIDEIVCPDFMNHFGEYEDDSVFVRNDKLRCDYEILYDQSKYSDRYAWGSSE